MANMDVLYLARYKKDGDVIVIIIHAKNVFTIVFHAKIQE